MKNEHPRRGENTAGAEAVGNSERNLLIAPPASFQSHSNRVDWAHAYAGRRWHVLPLYTVRDGVCTCCQDCGKNAGKHPCVKGGFKVATTDSRQIEEWWRKWPGANIGIATGVVSGLVVPDIDGEEGLALLKSLVARHGPLPRTPTVKTARGWHFYFALPASGVSIPCSAGGGLDVRGDGGYVVAPPSVHASGHVYRWCDHGVG